MPNLYRIFALALLSTAACATARLRPFPLEWRGVPSAPTADTMVAQAIATRSFMMPPMVDSRDKPNQVGQLADSLQPVLSTSDSLKFCDDRLRSMLKAGGLKIVSTGTHDELRTTLLTFEVIEGGMYNGEAHVKFELVRNGAPIWGEVFSGKSTRWGRTHSPDNFNEALSNSLYEVARSFLNSDSFAEAILGPRPKPVSPPAPPAPVAEAEPAAAAPTVVAWPVINLAWAGVESLPTANGPVASAISSHSLKLAPVVDERKNKHQVGTADDKRIAVTTPDDVAKFYGEQLETIFKSAGAKLVDKGKTAELRTSLILLNVDEGGFFNGEARLRFELITNGRIAYSTVVTGKSKRWGRTHKVSNYNEALSNAFTEAVKDLLRDTEFATALSK